MLKELIKKYNKKIVFSSSGILTMLTMVLPVIVLGMGIFLIVNNLKTGQSSTSAILIMAISVFFFFYTFKRIKPFFQFFQYIKNPETSPTYKRLKESGLEMTEIESEINEANVLNNLTKQNPLIITKSLIIGASKYAFFIIPKEDLLWAYEYNGNGLVLYDNHKEYGYVTYPTVDGNTDAIKLLKNDCPYAYFGLEFDYKKVMHEELDSTIEEIKNRIKKFKEDPSKYKAFALEEEKNKEVNEKNRLEEEKNKQLAEIEKREKESNLIKKEDSIKESEE